MKTAAAFAVATLALGALLWTADDAVVAPQPAANRQSLIANRQSADAVAIPHEKVQPPFSGKGTGTVFLDGKPCQSPAESGGSPQVLSYQGRLTDATGVPVADGLYAIRFRLYAQPTGGTHSWEENQQVTTRDGLFSILLGAVTAITTGDGRRETGVEAAYLGMTVAGSEEMTPRLRIAGGYTIPNDKAGANGSSGGGMDNDDEWVRSSPADSVLYTIRRLGIARGGCANVLYGNWKCSMTNLGSSCTTGISGAGGASLGNMAVLGGYGNRVWAPYTTVGGGRNNKAGNDATDTSAIVVGGYGNKANAKFSYIAGGQNNTADGISASIGGGSDNNAGGSYTSIGGGSANYAGTSYSTIGGGLNNVASNFAATVAGGSHNSATGPHSTVGGGASNTAQGDYSTAVGGVYSYAGYIATVGGGRCDTARGTYATVGGGDSNHADSAYATVPGGFLNFASNRCATVGGGWNSTASGQSTVVAGGRWNLASGEGATVGGGLSNNATGPLQHDCRRICL